MTQPFHFVIKPLHHRADFLIDGLLALCGIRKTLSNNIASQFAQVSDVCFFHISAPHHFDGVRVFFDVVINRLAILQASCQFVFYGIGDLDILVEPL